MHFLTTTTLLSTLALLSTGILASPSSDRLICPTKPTRPHDREISQGKYYKISAFVTKLDNITSDYFDAYWTGCDIPLALDCPEFTQNVAKFNQIHQTPALKQTFKDLGYPMLEYDGIIEFWVQDVPTWQKVTGSACWQGVRDDAKTFAKWPFQFMYGYEVLTFDKTGKRGPRD